MEKHFLADVPKFAPNITIEACREAVKLEFFVNIFNQFIRGRREFRETKKGDLLIFNYDFCFGETFPSPGNEM
jgi:hypothetical protein